jgi:hypothetical protein
VLAGALGVAVLSACDVDDLRPPEDEAEPTPSPTGSATVEPDPDTRLAEDTAYEIAVASVLVERVRREFPRLRGQVQPFVRMHRAHLEVLPAPEDRSIPVPSTPATRGEALLRVRTAEESLQRALVAASGEAQSGALARLLASMSASVTQHVAQHLPVGRA